MQTIKETGKNGEIKYKKPEGYKPLRRSQNDWFFADLSHPICEQVWEIGQVYNRRVKEKSIKHMNTFPIQLIRYFYFMYLTGARRMEPTMNPLSIDIQRMTERDEAGNSKQYSVVKITKVNEKHRSANGIDRKTMTQVIPIFDEAEQKMWNFITDGGTEQDPERMFRFAQWPSIGKSNLSGLIKTNFHTNLKDPRMPKKKHIDAGITPHILRHMRVFNVIVNHNVPEAYATVLFGWKDSKMIYYYAHLQETLGFKNQLDMLRRTKLLTDLNVDMLKNMQLY